MSTLFEEEEKGGNRAAGMLGYGIACILLGGVGLGFGAATFLPHVTNLQLLGSIWAAGGGDDLSITMMSMAVYAGGIVIFAGILGIISNFMKNRVVAVLALILVLGGSSLQIVGSIMYKGLMNDVFEVLEPNPKDTEFPAHQLALVNTGAAVHNYCCDRNATDLTADIKKDLQGDVIACSEAIDNSCDLPDVVTGILRDESNKLCTCFTNDVYSPIANFINANDVCKRLEAVEVAADPENEIVIPVTGDPKLSTILGQTVYDAYLPLTNMGMTGPVGPRFPASTNGVDLVDPSEGEEGFNCGLGYSKGILLIQYVYVTRAGETITIVLLALAGCQLLGVALVTVFWAMGGASNNDEWLDYEGGVVSPKDKF